MTIQRVFKDYALLWAMVVGAILSPWAYRAAWLLPYIMFAMLSLSYTRIAPSDLKLSRSHFVLFLIQWISGPVVYFLVRGLDEILAQGLAIIILTPTAVSASVITAMMGGSMGFVVAFLLIGNVAMSLLAPPMISWLYPDMAISYFATVMQIISKVSLLLIVPIVLIWSLRRGIPKLHDRLARHAGVTFYLWCISLVIITANTIHFFRVHDELTLGYGSVMSAAVLIVCVLLFETGRKVSKVMGDNPINGRQALGQKNTVLCIWVALTFMDPVVSVVPSFYVIWQNVVNSLELARYKKGLQTNNSTTNGKNQR